MFTPTSIQFCVDNGTKLYAKLIAEPIKIMNCKQLSVEAWK